MLVVRPEPNGVSQGAGAIPFAIPPQGAGGRWASGGIRETAQTPGMSGVVLPAAQGWQFRRGLLHNIPGWGMRKSQGTPSAWLGYWVSDSKIGH